MVYRRVPVLQASGNPWPAKQTHSLARRSVTTRPGASGVPLQEKVNSGIICEAGVVAVDTTLLRGETTAFIKDGAPLPPQQHNPKLHMRSIVIGRG